MHFPPVQSKIALLHFANASFSNGGFVVLRPQFAGSPPPNSDFTRLTHYFLPALPALRLMCSPSYLTPFPL